MSEKIVMEDIRDFLVRFLESAKDDKIFKDLSGNQKFFYMSGFLKGAMWAMRNKETKDNLKGSIKKEDMRKMLLEHLLQEKNKGGKRIT